MMKKCKTRQKNLSSNIVKEIIGLDLFVVQYLILLMHYNNLKVHVKRNNVTNDVHEH